MLQDVDDLTVLRARLLINQGKLPDALVALGTVVRAHPVNIEAWVLLAQVLSLQCRFVEALQVADRAVDVDPDHVGAQQVRTGLLLQLGHTEEARDAARRLIEMAPARSESYAFLAFAEAFVGNEASAIGAARTCKRLAPHRGHGHQALCVVHLTFRRWEKAERHAQAALAMEGEVASVLHDLGVAQYELGKFDDAHRAFQRAAELDPRFSGSIARLERASRTTIGTIAIIVVLAAGLALIPLSRVPSAFVGVALAGVAALLVAVRASGSRLAHWSESLRPVAAAVLVCDVAAMAYQLGVLR